ncbi:hypothetical protein BJY01DRAFT_704 [Aspergillus pseudoustus]|uniref:Uncharacterized protein n=1 Tax=Aspergillus pseudoustus TaxID=1810923 RepID=A0ABR4L4Z2_9EURO
MPLYHTTEGLICCSSASKIIVRSSLSYNNRDYKYEKLPSQWVVEGFARRKPRGLSLRHSIIFGSPVTMWFFRPNKYNAQKDAEPSHPADSSSSDDEQREKEEEEYREKSVQLTEEERKLQEGEVDSWLAWQGIDIIMGLVKTQGSPEFVEQATAQMKRIDAFWKSGHLKEAATLNSEVFNKLAA